MLLFYSLTFSFFTKNISTIQTFYCIIIIHSPYSHTTTNRFFLSFFSLYNVNYPKHKSFINLFFSFFFFKKKLPNSTIFPNSTFFFFFNKTSKLHTTHTSQPHVFIFSSSTRTHEKPSCPWPWNSLFYLFISSFFVSFPCTTTNFYYFFNISHAHS